MKIFKRAAARFSSTVAFDLLEVAIGDHDIPKISQYLALCSPTDQVKALNLCVPLEKPEIFALILQQVPHNMETVTRAGTVAARGMNQYLEHILPVASDNEKNYALCALVQCVDTLAEQSNSWQSGVNMLLTDGADPSARNNFVLEQAVAFNRGAAFEYLFVHGNPYDGYTNLTQELNIDLDSRIINALLPYATPDRIETLMQDAAVRGVPEYVQRFLSVCSDHSGFLACVIAGFSNAHPKKEKAYRQCADLLYPKSDPQKTLECLYEHHEEFMDDPKSFYNGLLKDLHEVIGVVQQRATLSKVVSEAIPLMVAQRKKM